MVVTAALAAAGLPGARAEALTDHFFGPHPLCMRHHAPVILVTDISQDGEIDDTVSLHAYRRLEEMGSVKVLAVVSIFGNGGAGTQKVHENLLQRLAMIGIDDWVVMPGPVDRVPFTRDKRLTESDRSRLEQIAAVIRHHDSVDIVELGPFTVSARLLMHEMVERKRISRIVGIGGRGPGERFSTGAGLPFAFRDMNVAEDRAAIRYLVAQVPGKLRLVTYRTGVGARMVSPETIGSIGIPAVADHARVRASRLKTIGYVGLVPLWDTWTTSYFLAGRPEWLGCRKMPVRMRHVPGFKPSDSLQLQLLDTPEGQAPLVMACHETE